MKKLKNHSRRSFSCKLSILQKKLFASILFLFLGFSVFAQEKPIVKGVVRDALNEPVIGATVLEKGTKNGTVTNVDGEFTLSVSSLNGTLSFSYLGTLPMDVPINGKTQLTATMQENNLLLDEVVVTALGIKRQTKALGYAISEVNGDDITAGRESNVISALSGRMAGVDVSGTSAGPSGSTRVIIRGNSQLTGSNMPLYVIDGVPLDNTQLGSAGKDGGYDYGDGLSAINPDDVQSISVLKGPSAAALYGSRASNGVVLITTKSAKGKQGLGIDVSMNANTVNLLSGFDDYQRVYGQGSRGQMPLASLNDAKTSTQTAWGAKLDPNLTAPIYNGEIKPYENVNNNILSFFRTGLTTTNSVALSGSNDNTDFRFSVSDMRNTDIVPESDMSRTSFMLKGSTKLGTKMSAEARVNYTTESVNNRPALSDSPNNIGNSIIGLAPSFDQQWLAAGYKDEYGRYNDWNGNQFRLNPYWVINEMSNNSTKNRVMGFAQLNYDITSYLTAQVKAGTDFYQFRATDFTPRYTPDVVNGRMTEQLVDVYQNNYEAILRFNKRFNEVWDISAFIGGNIMQYGAKTFRNTGNNQVIPDIEEITNYSRTELYHTNFRKQVNSIYGAVNLGYNDYAFVDFTLRNDISSTLNKDNRSYLYPSVSGSFVFSNFFKLEETTPISFGKIRASWAEVGGDTDPYQLSLNYGTLPYTAQGYSLGTISSSEIPNLDLKPTSNYSYEFGLDVRFFKNRLALDFGYYHQSSTNQIMNLSVTTATGYNSAVINAGEIVNKGIEMSLTGIPIKAKDFEWSATLNLAKNNNEVVTLHPDAPNYELAAARWANAYIYASEGQPYGNIVGKKFNRAPDGSVIYGANGMPTYGTELSVLGNGNYDFTLGFGNTFTYKTFALGVLFDMKWGAEIYSMTDRNAHISGISENTLEGREEWYASEEARRAANVTDVNNWTPTGGYVGKGVVNTGTADNPVYVPNTKVVDPQLYWSTVADNTPEPFIHDASYIKLRELTFSYNIPTKLLAKTPIRALSITAYGRNLWIIHSNVSNIDPESNYSNGNGQGLEYGSLPSRRSYGLGLNLKF